MMVSVACAAGLVAQDAVRPSIISSPDTPASAVSPNANEVASADQTPPPAPADPAAPRAQYNDPPPPPAGAAAAPGNYGNIPATLTLPSGAMVTVRVNQWLSSDRNQVGDTFYATLVQPLVVNGVVVARRGATVLGRVNEVHKSHTDASSRLGLQLTSLSLVDGQQVPIQSQVMDRNGTTAPAGSDVAKVGGGTAAGAAIGAIAGGGVGAGIGAGAGLVAGSIGALLTHGRPTEVYPESMLTFRLDAPVAISTTQAAAAFHYASQEDYGMNNGGRAPQMAPRPGVYGAPPPAAMYGGYPYPYYSPYYYPYYYGPGFSVFVGPGFRGGLRGFRR